MHAAILTESGFQIRDLPRPSPGRGEVLVRTQPLVQLYPLQAIETAFQDLYRGRSGLLKAVIQAGDASG